MYWWDRASEKDPIAATSSSPDDHDLEVKPTEDVIPAVQDPVKRSFDEAFDENHSHTDEVYAT